MQAQGHGSIVNVSSTMGHKGAAGASIYTASKHAVEGLTKSAALEGAAFDVRVNAVAPGPVETGMLNRFTGSERTQGRSGRRRAAAAHGNAGGDRSRRSYSWPRPRPASSPVTCSSVDGGKSRRLSTADPEPRHRPWIIAALWPPAPRRRCRAAASAYWRRHAALPSPTPTIRSPCWSTSAGRCI